MSYVVAAKKDGCQKVASSASGWSVKCKTYIIDYRANSEVKVTCTQFVSPYAPDMFAGYDFSQITTFHFVECPPPKNSFGQVLAGHQVTILLYQVYSHTIYVKSNFFLGLPELEVLEVTFQAKNNIPDDLFWHVNRLLVLQLTINLESVPKNLFRNLTSLITLSVVQNTFTTLPKDVFRDLGNLNNLFLVNGELQELPTEIFYPLTNLQILGLANNKFRRISSSHLNRLSNLTNFYINGNKLEELNGDLFRGNKNLEELDLGDNPTLPSLPYNLLHNLDRLQNLTIRDCNFTDIPDTFFSYASNLERIYMQNNRIQNISSVIFSRNPYLKEINMLYNDVYNITVDAFANLSNLESFILAKNNVMWFPQGLFDKMKHLRFLDASSTFLEFIQPNLFQSLHNLKVLALKNINIDTLYGKEPFGPGTSLEIVDLSYNNLQNTSGIDWSVYGGLMYLDLKYNNLENYSLPILQTKEANVYLQFSHMRRVSVDDLQDYIDGLPLNARKRNVTFSMDDNPFICDCHMFRFAEFIKNSMDTSKNKSYTVHFNNPEKYRCILPLEHRFKPLISIDKREFLCEIRDETCPEECDCYVRGFDDATVVDCTDSGLSSLPRILPFNTTELYFSQNKLTSLSALTLNLTLLDVSENEIESDNWTLPWTLTELRLQGNMMTWVPLAVQTLIKTKSDVLVYLGNNPFPCNCSVNELQNLLSTQANSFPDLANIYCTTTGPRPVKRLMASFSKDELCPTEGPSNLFILPVAFLVLATILPAGLALYFRKSS